MMKVRMFKNKTGGIMFGLPDKPFMAIFKHCSGDRVSVPEVEWDDLRKLVILHDICPVSIIDETITEYNKDEKNVVFEQIIKLPEVTDA